MKRSGRPGYQVTLLDASPFGCKLEFVERPTLDELLWVKFDGLAPLEAMVCWVEGFVAGVEFTNPIHPAVFEMLVRKKDAR